MTAVHRVRNVSGKFRLFHSTLLEGLVPRAGSFIVKKEREKGESDTDIEIT